MVRSMLPVALIAAIGFSQPCARAGSEFAFKSISVDLPAGDRMFPKGPNSDVADANCLACHSAGMVLNQPALSRSQWQDEVNKMRTAYKAPIDQKDVDSIVDYLVSIKGKR
jgi:cytochrome c553